MATPVRPETHDPAHGENSDAPWPGSHAMPRWNVDELVDAPRFTLKNWALLLGPGLVMGGAAIGGGEWLTGPMVTAKYGGGLLWLATLSILGQVLYNIEISRYTLYSGEPIFTGKFRTLPGPSFWIIVYLILDFGSIFPYLAAFAATPLATAILGEVPNAKAGQAVFHIFGSDRTISHEALLRTFAYMIFLGGMVPLVFGGKIFNALKAVMAFKIVTVFGFLLFLAVFYSGIDTWKEIFSGFVKFGNVPIRAVEDGNGNGILDPGEDWDHDGRLDVIEPTIALTHDTDGDGKKDATDLNGDGQPDAMVDVMIDGKATRWPDVNNDGQPDATASLDVTGDGQPDGEYALDRNGDGVLDVFVDVDGDGTQDGYSTGNLVTSAFTGTPMPRIDFTMVAILSALVAISGSGGLSNTPISNYTRDQGWGMGHHVGAIPSVIGGRNIQLSHVGTVFPVTAEALPRWKRWYRHVCRDQLAVWMPACFIGLALPTMLSVEFLKRGTVVQDKWVAASMTAGAVQERVGTQWGAFFWFMTLFCGFLVLAPSMATSSDGVIRRWVDAFWTASATLRRVDPKNIRYVYFTVLVLYTLFGLVMLSQNEPETLLVVSTTIYNFALAFSCWHALCVNRILLPRELRPGWFPTVGLFLAGVFFWVIATVSAMERLGYL